MTLSLFLFSLFPSLTMSTSFSHANPADSDNEGDTASIVFASFTASVQISQPSNLPIEVIKQLTHDELWHNAKFMRLMNLINALLFNVCSNSSGKFFFSFLTHTDRFYSCF